MPYPLLPVWLESIPPGLVEFKNQIVKTDAGREEILTLSLKGVAAPLSDLSEKDLAGYPIPSFNTIIPAARHFSYVFEWAFIALLTLGLCILLQFKQGRPVQKA